MQTDCSETHPACHTLRHESRHLGVADPGNLPFMLCPDGATTAALLVHGFTATPWEMQLLAEFLAEAGVASLAVCLPGHGTTPEDLAGRRWEEWLNGIGDGYRGLSGEFSSIFGMGMSTGSLLLLAAARTFAFDGLVLFSPYLRILHKLAPYAGWLRWVRPYHLKGNDNGPPNRYYARRPVAGIHQINRLIKSLRRQLASITCPVLAFNGEADQTIDLASSLELMAMLSSKVKIHEILGPDVPHVLTREENPCRAAMFAQATDFVQEIVRPGTPLRVR